MTTMIIGFKNGKELKILCEKFAVEKNGLAELTGIEFKGLKDIRPMYIDMSEILYVCEELESEEEE